MDFLNKLREAIDVETVGDKPEYPLPTPYEDVLNNARNIQDYIFAKRILEHPEINKVLENMDAFSKLNKFDINTYKDLANQVADAVKAYDEENKDTEFVSEINLFENVEVVSSEELNEFQELFLLEFIGNSMMSNISQMSGNMPKMGMNDPKVGMDTDVTTSGSDGKFDDVPVKANSWLDKLMQKLGVNTGELALLTVIHHFMNKNKENKASKEQSYGMNDLKQSMPSPSQGVKEPAMAMESLTDEGGDIYVRVINRGEGTVEKEYGPYKPRRAEKLERTLVNKINLDLYRVESGPASINESLADSEDWMDLDANEPPPPIKANANLSEIPTEILVRELEFYENNDPDPDNAFEEMRSIQLIRKELEKRNYDFFSESINKNKNYDFSKTSTKTLKTLLLSLNGDDKTETIDAETRRPNVIREVNKELKRRGGNIDESYDTEISYAEAKTRLSKAGWKEAGGIGLWSHPDHDFWLDGNSGYLIVYHNSEGEPFGNAGYDAALTAFNTLDKFFEWLKSGKGDRVGVMKESDDGFMKVKSERPKRSVDKVSKKVKDDVKQRIKELDDLIAKYNEKKHFYGDVKPEIFDAKEVLNVIMDKLKSGSEESFKEAQLHFQKVESRIFHLFPPSLIKFLSHQSDGSDSVGEEIKVKTT